VKQSRPLCFFKTCEASETMIPDIMPFMELFTLLRSDVYKRQPFELLDRACATTHDVDVFAFMAGIVSEHQDKKLKGKARRKTRRKQNFRTRA
jgi:hypothetical protein